MKLWATECEEDIGQVRWLVDPPGSVVIREGK